MLKNKKYKIQKSYNLYLWKILADLWGIITILLFVLDFLSGNKIDSSASVIGIVYVAILGIFASSKEFERWRSKTYQSKSYGEAYVVIWTIIMIIFSVLAPFSQGKFKVPEEFAVTYISILGILAVTMRSKQMYLRKSLKTILIKKKD